MALVFPPVKESDVLSVSQFADVFGFPVSALITAIERQRGKITKPFYSISDLAERWGCSRATVYAVLHESEFKVLNLSRSGKSKGRKLIPAATVEKIEQSRMRSLAA